MIRKWWSEPSELLEPLGRSKKSIKADEILNFYHDRGIKDDKVKKKVLFHQIGRKETIVKEVQRPKQNVAEATMKMANQLETRIFVKKTLPQL